MPSRQTPVNVGMTRGASGASPLSPHPRHCLGPSRPQQLPQSLSPHVRPLSTADPEEISHSPKVCRRQYVLVWPQMSLCCPPLCFRSESTLEATPSSLRWVFFARFSDGARLLSPGTFHPAWAQPHWPALPAASLPFTAPMALLSGFPTLADLAPSALPHHQPHSVPQRLNFAV